MEAETTGRKKLPSTHTAEADLLQLLTAEAIYPGKETNNLYWNKLTSDRWLLLLLPWYALAGHQNACLLYSCHGPIRRLEKRPCIWLGSTISKKQQTGTTRDICTSSTSESAERCSHQQASTFRSVTIFFSEKYEKGSLYGLVSYFSLQSMYQDSNFTIFFQ